ncbi:DeoR/GlpR transcriptional regulator [Alginatibacterium sediminis]|uniref:DeoR/GlpR transcriptional regulator n=1 Tax=Alginatibacterium sediminis TaxID=2164068 RepID=A0A420EDR0_9ALTE|nr:DeoR/GlpR family DNA-binding transcription regulator [Alginatibacterium sediminis]RKF18784.1 DeoR/GlpR transcriptional regulator [Alginatibacterium sediminis]
MFAEERQNHIIEILNSHGKVSVADLSRDYGVTAATVRADLKVLEELGLLVKTHGGAILKSKASFELGSDKRKSLHETKKLSIGSLAASMVDDHETIILDTGTTSLQLAKGLLNKKGLKVITNDFEVASVLEHGQDLDIIFLGGLVKRHYHCTYHFGNDSIVNTLNVDKAFMGTNSFSIDSGASVADLNLAETKRLMVKQAREIILMCDSSKLGKTSLAVFARAEQIDVLVTDTPPHDIDLYTQAGIKVLN